MGFSLTIIHEIAVQFLYYRDFFEFARPPIVAKLVRNLRYLTFMLIYVIKLKVGWAARLKIIYQDF